MRRRFTLTFYPILCGSCLLMALWTFITAITISEPPGTLWHVAVGRHAVGMARAPQTPEHPGYIELWVNRRQPLMRLYAIPMPDGTVPPVLPPPPSTRQNI